MGSVFSVLCFIHPLPPAGYSPLSQRESQLQQNITAPADCPPETGGRRGSQFPLRRWVKSVATEGVDSLRFRLPLRPLSRVASDYSSGSVVCFWILRPLRPLREIKIRTIVFHAKNAESAKFLFTFVFHAGAEGVANFVTTRVRRGRMTIEYSKQLLVFCQPLRSLVARSQRPLTSNNIL